MLEKMMVMMEKFLLKMFIFGRLVLDYNEACTNEEDCQDWIVKIKVKNLFSSQSVFIVKVKVKNKVKNVVFLSKCFYRKKKYPY